MVRLDILMLIKYAPNFIIFSYFVPLKNIKAAHDNVTFRFLHRLCRSTNEQIIVINVIKFVFDALI